MMKRV